MLLDLFAPGICAACGAHAGRGRPLCRPCRAGLRRIDAPFIACGVDTWAPVAYEGAAAAVVQSFKFSGRRRLAAAMAAQIVASAPPGWLDAGALVPVPLARARRAQRGYNQAADLAGEIAARTGLELADCLERGDSRTQVGLGRSSRAAVARRISLAPALVPPAEVLLVDDVVTTGATLAACAVALGSARVRAVTFARTMPR